MTTEELREVYFELLQAELKNFQNITLTGAPKPIQLAVEKLVEYDSKDATVQSESIGGHLSQTFFQMNDFPSDVKRLIEPYRVRRLEFI